MTMEWCRRSWVRAAFASALGLAVPGLAQSSASASLVTAAQAASAPKSYASTREALESPTFLEDLEVYTKKQSAPAEELRHLAQSDDLLGMARLCAVATHERWSRLGILPKEGIPVFPKEGIPYCRRLAESQIPVGMFLYGRAYQYGRGVEKDYEEAARWYRKGAEGGNPLAMNNLALLYERGRGVDRDEEEAARWYRKGAEANDAMAQRNLGRMYADGEGGLPRNIYVAIDWYVKAADRGNSLARRELERLGVPYPRGTQGDRLRMAAISLAGQLVAVLVLAYLLFGEFREAIKEATAADTPAGEAEAEHHSKSPDGARSAGSLAATPPASAQANAAAASRRSDAATPPAHQPEVPHDIRAAAATPEGAKALLYALLLANGDARTHQLATLLKEAGPQLAGQADRFSRALQALDPRVHVMVIERIMSSLKEAGEGERDATLALVTRLIEARPRPGIEPLVLWILCKRYFGRQFLRVSHAVEYVTLHEIAPQVALVISLFIHLARSSETGFERTMGSLGLSGQSLVPLDHVGATALDSAFGELSRLAPLAKPKVVMSCFEIAQVDGRLPPAQEELMRALCAVIDSPLPPGVVAV